MKSKLKRHCFSCDLKDNSELIAMYKEYHKTGNVWPEITESIKAAGLFDMPIYLTENRLFLVMEVNESYDPKLKANQDRANPKVQEWENLMSTFQQALPWANKGEKWCKMEQIFQLE